jgi:hypothetical protein
LVSRSVIKWQLLASNCWHPMWRGKILMLTDCCCGHKHAA